MRKGISAAAVGFLLATGCADGDGAGPPRILYGEDICDRCRMVISEERHAAGAIVDGRVLRFDDPGCLLAALEEPAGRVEQVWIHGEQGAWLTAAESWFVEDPDGGTPMASGLLAFGSEGAARAAAERYDSPVRRWEELRGAASP